MTPAVPRGEMVATRRGPPITTVAGIVAAVVILLIIPNQSTTGHSWGARIANESKPVPVATLESLNCGTILPNQTISNVVNGTNVAVANRTWDARQIARMFWEVCTEPEFGVLITVWGAENLTLDIYGVVGVLVYSNFTIQWENWTGAIEYESQECWTGTVLTGAISGPVLLVGPPGAYSVPPNGGSGVPTAQVNSSHSSTFGDGLPIIALSGSTAVGVAIAGQALIRTRIHRPK